MILKPPIWGVGGWTDADEVVSEKDKNIISTNVLKNVLKAVL